MIHPSAVVADDAVLEPGVRVDALAVVGPGVSLGAGTHVMSGAQVQGPTTMGRDNRIFPHAMIGFEPQDLKFQGEETRLEVGDGNQFREGCTIHRGTTQDRGVTRIGSHNLFMVNTHVAHDCTVGDHTVFANNATLAGHVEVQDHAVISAFTSVQQFCRVGRHAYIGGYSVLIRDSLPFVKTVGVKPACYGVNRIGLERRGFESDAIKAIERAYRLLVRSKLARSTAVERIVAEEGGRPEIDFLVEFIQGSQRGVITSLPGRAGHRGAA
ncbi:MAG: acyl-ACP--UDP-N-acetylglucosamine O-acyltransferase [Acidobacteriota bacterium]